LASSLALQFKEYFRIEALTRGLDRPHFGLIQLHFQLLDFALSSRASPRSLFFGLPLGLHAGSFFAQIRNTLFDCRVNGISTSRLFAL